MKSTIAAVLLLLGLGAIVASAFVGNKVGDEAKLTETQEEEFSTLLTSVHQPTRRVDPEREAKLERLGDMRRQLVAAAEAQKRKKAMIRYAGFGLGLLGICLQVWAWTDKRA